MCATRLIHDGIQCVTIKKLEVVLARRKDALLSCLVIMCISCNILRGFMRDSTHLIAAFGRQGTKLVSLNEAVMFSRTFLIWAYIVC